MSAHEGRESLPSSVEQEARATDGPHEPIALGDPSSPYLLAPEAAAYLRFASTRALYKAVKADGIPCRRRGNKTLLFHRGDLDRWLAGADARDLRREARQRGAVQPVAMLKRVR